jgi:hypothetical protein
LCKVFRQKLYLDARDESLTPHLVRRVEAIGFRLALVTRAAALRAMSVEELLQFVDCDVVLRRN